MAQLSITLLGAPRFERDGLPLQISTRKAIALLAYLAVTAVPHTRDALATLFWPEADTAHARGALRYTLAQLKAALGDEWLAISREQIGLAPGAAITVDALRVRSLLAEVQAHRHEPDPACSQCLARLQEIVELGTGPLLAGFGLPDAPAFDDWLMFEAERNEQTQSEALARLIASQRALGNPGAAIPYAQRRLALDPLDEQSNRLLIELYLANRQGAAARRHHAAFVKLFVEEFGTAPDAALGELIENAPSDEQTSPVERVAIPPAPAPTNWLPQRPLATPKTPLLGRAGDLAAIGELLDSPNCRLLTLLGPGGSGKTRLALALAETRQTNYQNGVTFVPLAGLTTPNMVDGTIAAAVGCPQTTAGDLQQQLLDSLRSRHMLLILDNVEQLLEEDHDSSGYLTTLLDAILTKAPNVQLLVTSRTRLQLYEEQLYPVNGLLYPTSERIAEPNAFSAIELFVQCARRVQPHFALTAATTPAVAKIVRLLAGQPLAIELAAAWVSVLTPAEILAELTAGIDLLATEARNIPARHRSMRATYLFSWERLRPEQQALHQALAVFRGGFTRAAAAYVTAATPRTLQALIDQSLLSHHVALSNGGRYEMHELLRQFAAEQLAANPDLELRVRTRHAAYYLGHVAAQGANLSGSQQWAALSTIETKLENVQTAWVWAVEQKQFGVLAEGLGGLCEFYQWRGRVEEGIAAIRALVECLEQLAASAPLNKAESLLLGHALAWQAAFEIVRGHLAAASALAERSLPLLNHATNRMRAFPHYLLGQVGFLSSDLAAARRWLESSLTLYQSDTDQVGAATALGLLGRTAWLAGDYAQSRLWYLNALSLYQSRNEPVESARTIADLALVALNRGELAEGMQWVRECQTLMATFHDPQEIVRVRRKLGTALLYTGYFAEGQTEYEACIAANVEAGSSVLKVNDYLMLALAHITQRHHDFILSQGHEIFAMARQLGLQRDAGFALMLIAYSELAQGSFQRAADLFHECMNNYLVINHADDQSMAWMGLCLAQRALGDAVGARQAAVAALRLAAAGRGVRASAFALIAYANILLDAGDASRAIEIETLLTKSYRHTDAGFFHDFILQPVTNIISHLSPHLVEQARLQGRNRDFTATVAEFLTEIDQAPTPKPGAPPNNSERKSNHESRSIRTP